MLHALIIYFIWIFISTATVLVWKTPFFETFLKFYLGAGGVLHFTAFMGHTFKADQIARFIGWAPGSPFQYEIAVANLSYAAMGIMCLWLENGFWLATIVGMAVFGWGAAIGHIYQIKKYKNYAQGNAGVILYMDIAAPVISVILYIGYKLAG